MKKLIAILLCMPLVANAGFHTGNDLLRYINSSESYEKTYAVGFVVGVHDSFEGEIICSGSNVTAGQLRDVVKQFLESNPARRDLGAAVLTMISLAQAFPCNNKPQKGRSS